MSGLSTDIPQLPGILERLAVVLRRAARKFGSWLTVPAAKEPDRTPRNTEAHRLARIRAHFDPRHLPHLLPLAPHTGAGGARNRAISDRMSANICLGTPTSASWNATYRP